MRWRALKLDYRYAAGELAIVTAGVLIALAIDQWNSNRLDQAEEVVIVNDLLVDLDYDRAGIELGLGFTPEKEASLWRVYGQLSSAGSAPKDPVAFLEDIIEGSRYGWSQFIERRTTFDELLGSGRFNLIRDSELRAQISAYYAYVDEVRDRIVERKTEYPNLSYKLAPRTDEFDLDPSLSSDQVAQLAARATQLLPGEIVIAEINFSRFTNGLLLTLEQARGDLYDRLQSYRQAIR